MENKIENKAAFTFERKWGPFIQVDKNNINAELAKAANFFPRKDGEDYASRGVQFRITDNNGNVIKVIEKDNYHIRDNVQESLQRIFDEIRNNPEFNGCKVEMAFYSAFPESPLKSYMRERNERIYQAEVSLSKAELSTAELSAAVISGLDDENPLKRYEELKFGTAKPRKRVPA